MWAKVISHTVNKHATDNIQRFWIHQISKNSSDMILYSDADGKYIHFPFSPNDRVPFAAEVVDKATAFRIGVDIDETKQRIMRYVVFVQPLEFELQVVKCVKGEVYIAQLLKEIWVGAVPDMLIQAPPKTPQGKLCKEWSYRLTPQQARSVVWMKQHEKHIIRKDRLEFNQGIRVTKTDWYFDYNLSSFSLHVSTGLALPRGGILADGTGTGKTASMLRLVLETRDTHFESHIHSEYESKATLVIVPINLPAQWMAEIEKFTGSHLNVIPYYTGSHVRERSMADLLAADIVLTTFAFIRSSKPYHDMIETNVCSATDPLEDRRLHLCFSAVRAWARAPGRTAPIIHAVAWKRVIIDEIHEIIDQKDFRLVTAFQCHILWGMTATPDIHSDRAHCLYALLQGAHARHPELLSEIVATCVRGVGSSSSFESHIFRVDVGGDIRERMDGMSMEQVVKLGMSVVDEYCTGSVSVCSADSIRSMLVNSRMQDNASLLFRESHACSICLDKTCSAITNCGHTYCHKCITTHIANSNACPMCRTLLLKNGIVSVVNDKVATKLEVLAQMIAELTTPAIVFAQYRTMLRALREMLMTAGLRVVALEGNIFRRTRLLNLFTREGGVLLICMQDSYAGLHLPCAQHIIFSHALLGDKQSVADMEEQAIARAVRPGQKHHVKVHSFVIADSPEEDLWMSTHVLRAPSP